MKWIGWAMAVLCMLGFIAIKQQNGKKLREADRQIDQELAGVKEAADEKVRVNQKALQERLDSLENQRQKAAELESQRDALKASETELKEKMQRLIADTDKLRDAERSTASTRSENREEIQELQERINQADRRTALWDKMIEMVSEPTEAN